MVDREYAYNLGYSSSVGSDRQSLVFCNAEEEERKEIAESGLELGGVSAVGWALPTV
jgi:hypothetical protein